MKLTLIVILATIANCIAEDGDLDSMNKTGRIELIELIDSKHFQEIARNYSRMKNGKNHENMTFRRGRHYDYGSEEYDYEDEYDDYSEEYDDKRGKYYDKREKYDGSSEEYDDEYEDYDDEYVEFDDSYEDYYEEYESYEDEENCPGVVKLKELLLNKPDATVSVKFHNFTYSVPDEKAGPRKGPVGRFAEFNDLLSSAFSESILTNRKRIHLYYIVFSVDSKGLFDTKGQTTFTFSSLKKNKAIRKGTDLVAREKNAILDIQGKVNLRVKFSLGNKENSIITSDGSKSIFFDPELRMNYNCFMYSVLGFVSPSGLSSKKTTRLMEQFSKLMSSAKNVEKFIEAYKGLPDYTISKQGISTGVKNNVLFDMFKVFIKEKQQNSVEIRLFKAAEAFYKHISKEGSISNHTYGDIKIPENGFATRTDAGKPMQGLFNDAMRILKDNAAKISQGEDVGKIRNSIMKYFKKQFQEHRKLAKNNLKFREVKNHFGVFKKSFKQKVPS